jgi:hypothetical protein
MNGVRVEEKWGDKGREKKQKGRRRQKEEGDKGRRREERKMDMARDCVLRLIIPQGLSQPARLTDVNIHTKGWPQETHTHTHTHNTSNNINITQ